jgi:hypothetical protein
MLLGRTRDQLQLVAQNKRQYEKAWEQAVRAGESFALSLPALTEQLNGELADQDQALDELARSISDVGWRATGRRSKSFSSPADFLAWLLAAGFGLHGAYLLAGAAPRRRITPREGVSLTRVGLAEIGQHAYPSLSGGGIQSVPVWPYGSSSGQ